MLIFECKDLGLDCDYVATAETIDDVMEMVMTHAVETHGDMLKDLTQEQVDEMEVKIESLIKAGEEPAAQAALAEEAGDGEEETEEETEEEETDEADEEEQDSKVEVM